MAKNRNRKKSPGGTQLLERARRELGKGNTKTAVKDAEACFRQDPRPECRTLLEQAYVGRVEQLHRLRMPAEARAILRKLIDLKPTDQDILQRLPRLQVVVGDAGADEATVLEQEPELLATLADQAVLDPRSLAPQHGGVAKHVERVRQAFAAVERGDDDAAAEALRDLPRSSPLGDWKLFVRGLSSFYLGNAERTQANWQRLDRKRPAFRIAQTLLVADGQLRRDQAEVDVTGAVAQLQARLQANPAAGSLNDLAEYWREGDWHLFFREYRCFRHRFAGSHAPLIEKIVDLVWKRAISDRDSRVLERLQEVGPPPALDPHWDRIWALGIERFICDYRHNFERPWQNYIDNLPNVSCLREEERSIAAGLIHRHLAKRLFELATHADRAGSYSREASDPELGKEIRMKAAQRLRQAIENCPQLTDAYLDLARFHEEHDDPQSATAVWRLLVDVEPDHFDAHVWLANHYLGRNEPEESEAHVQAALRLRPRDRQCAQLRWNQRAARVRSLLLGRRCDEARREVEAAAEIAPDGLEPFVLDCMRAAVELKAKQLEAGQRHVDTALRHAGEPAAVWMAMSGAAAEYRLPRDVKKEFDNRFKSAIQARPTSRTAGLLAWLLLSLKSDKRNYTGRATQERLTLKYLGRARRIAWAEADLQMVCELLDSTPHQERLQAALVAVGLKQFPKNPHFHYLWANRELDVGIFRCNYELALRHFDQALELARASESPSDRALIPLAERAVAALEEVRERANIALGLWDDEDDEDDDEYEYDDENDAEAGDGPPGPQTRQMAFFHDNDVDQEDDDDDEEDGQFSIDEVFANISKRLPPELIEAARRAFGRAFERFGKTGGKT